MNPDISLILSVVWIATILILAGIAAWKFIEFRILVFQAVALVLFVSIIIGTFLSILRILEFLFRVTLS